MKANEQAFLATIALGWFSVDAEGRIWRLAEMIGGSRTGAPAYPRLLPTAVRAERASSRRDGYPKVMFRLNGRREAVYAHRIVWMVRTGQPIPDGMEINHKDGNKKNPHPDNLELLTHAENTLHSFRTLGQKVKAQHGSANTSAKLTEADVLEIRSLCAARRMAQTKIAERFGVSQRTISDIHLRKAWGHLRDSTG